MPIWPKRSPSPTRAHAIAVFGPLVIAVLALWATFIANRAGDAREALVHHTDQVENTIANLDGSVTDAAFGCRGWVLFGDSVEHAHTLSAIDSSMKQEAQLRALTSDNASQQRRLDTTDLALHREFVLLNQAAALSASGKRTAALAVLAPGGPQDSILAEVHALTDRLTAEEARLRTVRVKAERKQRAEATLVLLVGVGMAVILSMVMSAVLARAAVQEAQLSGELREANTTLMEQAAELEMQTQTLEEQAGELEMANEELATTSEQLAERSEVAEAANRAKSEFLTRMSHELRTPLNAITGYASLLNQGVRGPVTDVQQEDVTRILRAAQHLLGLINDVLNFARLEVGRVEFDIGDVPATVVLSEAAAMIEPLAAARGLEFSRGEADGLVLKADRERAVQIVINLLTNAVKFTPTGGRVDLRAFEGGDGTVEIVVTDSGRGIPPEALNHIFDPFVQVGRSMTGGGEGLGLGLAISSELARAMAGTLRVTSNVGQGSVFTLVLPRATR